MPPEAGTLRILKGVAEVADTYDAAILDSWGVLHDGIRPYPGVLECLTRLRVAGWRLIVLSNAPRTGKSVRQQVEGFGIPSAAYDGIVTSGDLTRAALRARTDPWHARLGRRFYHLGPDRDHGVLDGIDVKQVPTPEDCDFILNTGLFDDETETEADYADFLAAARARALPMICANPDIEVNRGGRRIPCAGAVARAYEAIGGDVVYHGKPGVGAFDACMGLLPGVPRERVLCVGDSLRTDIAGASAAGIDALFVVQGIHAADFGPSASGELDAAALSAALRGRKAAPAAAINTLVW